MAVYSIDEIDQSKIGEFINTGSFARVCRYDDYLVLKKFFLNDLYDFLVNYQPMAFLNHLERLSTYSSPILVCPKDIFINKHEKVEAYTMDFCAGTYLSEDISEFGIERLMKILKKFYDELMLIDDLLLNDPNPSNLIINEDLKFFDLDCTKFIKSCTHLREENVKMLNYSIFLSLFGNRTSLVDIKNEKLAELFCNPEAIPIRLDKSLENYIEYVNKHIRRVNKVKDLRR